MVYDHSQLGRRCDRNPTSDFVFIVSIATIIPCIVLVVAVVLWWLLRSRMAEFATTLKKRRGEADLPISTWSWQVLPFFCQSVTAHLRSVPV